MVMQSVLLHQLRAVHPLQRLGYIYILASKKLDATPSFEPAKSVKQPKSGIASRYTKALVMGRNHKSDDTTR
jgi:hypothetical protein